MKKKKIRIKTPDMYRLFSGVKDQGSDFFWRFTDAQIEKIDRKITKYYEGRQDEHGFQRPGWLRSFTVDGVCCKDRYTTIKNAFDVHAMQRIFLGEKHEAKWEFDDVGRIL